jgi:hypothetical protein
LKLKSHNTEGEKSEKRKREERREGGDCIIAGNESGNDAISFLEASSLLKIIVTSVLFLYILTTNFTPESDKFDFYAL